MGNKANGGYARHESPKTYPVKLMSCLLIVLIKFRSYLVFRSSELDRP